MLKLDRRLRRHSRVVLAVWGLLVLAAMPLAMHQGDRLTGGGYTIPGSDSSAAEQELERSFDRGQRATLAAVVVPDGDATTADARAAILRLARAATAQPDVTLPPAAQRAALRATAAAGHRQRPIVVPLRVAVGDDQAIDVAVGLRDRLGLGHENGGPVRLHLVGQSALWAGMQDLSKSDLAKAEGTGFPIVALILVAVFGSLVAAVLPLALGLVSVLLTGAIIYLLSLVMDMSIFVTNMASMIGIGVAVDYSLFVLARYRQEIRAGASPQHARAAALATSGVAVTFSGLTVIVSLAGLYLVDATAIRSMALGAIVVVAVSVLAAATLLPLLISLLGRRVYTQGRVFAAIGRSIRSRRRRAGSTRPDQAPREGFWDRWTALVTRRPAVAATLAAAVLVGLAVPALGLQTTDGALRQFPAGNETRQGFEAAGAVTGPGASSPIKLIVPSAQERAVRSVLVADPEVARVARPVVSRDGRQVLLQAIPRHDGEAREVKDAVKRLRTALPAGTLVGGASANLVDFDTHVFGSMWKVALFVMAMSFLVLLLLLRSIVLPLKAVVMNILSVGAAYGVLVLVFGEVDTLTPPLVLAVVFGLSMDYEVFLLSRIRERFAATRDTQRAVAQGLASSAGTITSAALIMVCVFGVFALTGVPSIQQLGLGCAVAIAVDATIVRLVLVPAAMELLGEWNWWLPRPLARVLPPASIETLGQSAAIAAGTPD
jgi:RND superfamily putative drug exporter